MFEACYNLKAKRISLEWTGARTLVMLLDKHGGGQDRGPANYKQTQTKRDIRSFLGLAGYYLKFVIGFAEHTARLSDLTAKRKSDQVVWTPELQRDFDELKRLMSLL